MNALRIILIILHFVGLAALLGGALEQVKSEVKRISTTMVWGARAQIVTGVALVGMLYANDLEPDNAKIAVKLVVALAIAGIAERSARTAGSVPRAWAIVGALTVANIAVAVAW